MIKVTIRTLFDPFSATSPVILGGCLDPRGALLEASWSADRGRWSRQGATRTPASRQPKLHGPGAPLRASLGALGGMSYRRRQPPRHSRPPQRWLGFATARPES